MARRRQRAIDLAVLQSETAQLQVEALRAELTGLHQELARRDVELISALTRVAAVTDRLRLQTEHDRDDHGRLTRAIELLTMFIASPPPALVAGRASGTTPPPRASTPTEQFTEVVPTDAGPSVGTVIGGSIDPSRLNADPAADLEQPAGRAIDLTAEVLADLPVAPATRDERPLRLRGAPAVRRPLDRRLPDRGDVQDGDRTQFRLRRRGRRLGPARALRRVRGPRLHPARRRRLKHG